MSTSKAGSDHREQMISKEEVSAEINLILDHSLKNSLSAFGLQSQLLHYYLMNEFDDSIQARALEISRKTDAQVRKMDELIEELRRLHMLIAF